MRNRFIGHIDALVRGTEIILKNTRGCVGGKYHMGQSQSGGNRYLSFRPYENGNMDI